MPGGVTQVACAQPPADEGGVQFLCYAVDAAGAVVVARVTVNDYGTPELAAFAAGGATVTTVAVADSATTAVYTGTGSQTVPVDPVPSLMAGGDHGQRVRTGDRAAGPCERPGGATDRRHRAPEGRYLIGSAGLFSSLAVTADRRLDDPHPAAVERDRPRSRHAGERGAARRRLLHRGGADRGRARRPTAAAITVSALSAAGPVSVLEQAGPYSGPITVPEGPGFLAVDIAGPWTISAAAATPHHHLIAMTILDEDYGCPSA